jgi:hypothetical protein
VSTDLGFVPTTETPHGWSAKSEQLFGAEISSRYILGPQLTRFGQIDTFNATDLWLDRRVALVLGTVDKGKSLVQVGRMVAKSNSPSVVHVFDCGNEGDHEFVVFELPVFTLAFLAREARLYGWEAVHAMVAARALLVGLDALHRAGVGTDDLHLGSIGIDGIGNVRVSPWALAYSEASSNAGDGDLVATVLETASQDASGARSKAGEHADRLRLALSHGSPLTCGEILKVLDDGSGGDTLCQGPYNPRDLIPEHG